MGSFQGDGIPLESWTQGGKRHPVSVSEASLSFCLAEIRKGLSLKEVADLVKEKFEGNEQEIAIEWLRNQHRIKRK